MTILRLKSQLTNGYTHHMIHVKYGKMYDIHTYVRTYVPNVTLGINITKLMLKFTNKCYLNE